MLRYLLVFLFISSYSFGQVKNSTYLESTLLDTNIYVTVDQMPVFGKGASDLQQYIGENLIYPSEVAAKKISGTVQVQFVIDREGSPIDVRILRSAHTLLDEEAMRVIKTMPRWRPGYKNGIPVRVQCTLPIVFMLPD